MVSKLAPAHPSIINSGDREILGCESVEVEHEDDVLTRFMDGYCQFKEVLKRIYKIL